MDTLFRQILSGEVPQNARSLPSGRNENPVFYQECVDRYGENLDKEGIAKNFIQLENPTVWASYVLIPLCEYYKTYYAEHPDDPNYEEIKSSGSSGTYWKDPIALLR